MSCSSASFPRALTGKGGVNSLAASPRFRFNTLVDVMKSELAGLALHTSHATGWPSRWFCALKTA